jgi:hypothetical protein
VSYPVREPCGRAVFKIIGVDAQTDVSLTPEVAPGADYYYLDREDLERLIRRLRVLPDSAWWEESLEYWIE